MLILISYYESTHFSTLQWNSEKFYVFLHYIPDCLILIIGQCFSFLYYLNQVNF